MFELLMRRYNERVQAARAIVRDEQEAEDVMQQARQRLHPPSPIQRLCAIFDVVDEDCDQRTLARVRRKRRTRCSTTNSRVREPFMSRNPSENPEQQAFTGELRELLEWAIDTLSDGMREVFVLRESKASALGSGGVPRSNRGCRQDSLVARVARG